MIVCYLSIQESCGSSKKDSQSESFQSSGEFSYYSHEGTDQTSVETPKYTAYSLEDDSETKTQTEVQKEFAATSPNGRPITYQKMSSPGYYRIKRTDSYFLVEDLWDDGSVAATYTYVRFADSLKEFKKRFGNYVFYNPLTEQIITQSNNICLFGPVNDDFDERTGKSYDVYGVFMMRNGRTEYYENTMGLSDTFTFIQDLRTL